MKLVNADTKQYTNIKKDEFGEWEIQAAADRLVSRVMKWHFCQPLNFLNFEDKTDANLLDFCFSAEAQRNVGDLTEHTGKRFYFEIVK